jgi:hypothetical protein
MLEKGLSASTVNVRLSAVRKLIGEAQRNGITGAEEAANLAGVPNLLLMPSSFCLPPVEASAGTIPTQAENSWPFLKAAPFPMAAIRAVAGAALREQE